MAFKNHNQPGGCQLHNLQCGWPECNNEPLPELDLIAVNDSNIENRLKPCPMCGSKAIIGATGTVECYGRSWQTIYIECTDEARKHCGMSYELRADFSDIDHGWDKSITWWNSLKRY